MPLVSLTPLSAGRLRIVGSLVVALVFVVDFGPDNPTVKAMSDIATLEERALCEKMVGRGRHGTKPTVGASTDTVWSVTALMTEYGVLLLHWSCKDFFLPFFF